MNDTTIMTMNNSLDYSHSLSAGTTLTTHRHLKNLLADVSLPERTESNDSNIIKEYFKRYQTNSFSFDNVEPSASRQLEEVLFDATSSVKIAMSQVAMHVDRQFRNKLFSQIDTLHDLDEWDEDDNPINKDSFLTFIKGILNINPSKLPGLGLSHDGNLIAAWIQGKNRLILEFLPDNNRVEWVVSRYFDEELDRATGKTPVLRLLDCLAPYDPEIWFQ